MYSTIFQPKSESYAWQAFNRNEDPIKNSISEGGQ